MRTYERAGCAEMRILLANGTTHAVAVLDSLWTRVTTQLEWALFGGIPAAEVPVYVELTILPLNDTELARRGSHRAKLVSLAMYG